MATSVLDNPRVQQAGKGYTVNVQGTAYRVLYSSTFRWVIYTGPNMDMAMLDSGRPAVGFASAEDAVGLLLDQ
jgi:hypothetical protein